MATFPLTHGHRHNILCYSYQKNRNIVSIDLIVAFAKLIPITIILENAVPQPTIITRFAPSPTGYLHLGHAYSALAAADFAKRNKGVLLLRLEDIDSTRCKPDFSDAILEDLSWLGIVWHGEVRVQSEHMADYRAALETLKAKALAYPCFCTRKQIKVEIEKSPAAPHGPEGHHYPGTCKKLSCGEIEDRLSRGEDHCWRLDTAKAVVELKASHHWPLTWHDSIAGEQIAAPESLGDVVLARKDTPTSYHLSVTVDDALQNITDVVRGEDLFHTTHIHRLLQALLGLATPNYHHHELMVDESGKRFAKRDQAKTLKSMREEGMSAHDIIAPCRNADTSNGKLP